MSTDESLRAVSVTPNQEQRTTNQEPVLDIMRVRGCGARSLPPVSHRAGLPHMHGRLPFGRLLIPETEAEAQEAVPEPRVELVAEGGAAVPGVAEPTATA